MVEEEEEESENAHSFMTPVLEHIKITTQICLQDNWNHFSPALTQEGLTTEVGVNLVDLSQHLSHVRLRHRPTCMGKTNRYMSCSAHTS